MYHNPTGGDANLDGIVNVFDLGQLANNYGKTAGGDEPVGQSAALEPTAAQPAEIVQPAAQEAQAETIDAVDVLSPSTEPVGTAAARASSPQLSLAAMPVVVLTDDTARDLTQPDESKIVGGHRPVASVAVDDQVDLLAGPRLASLPAILS